MNIPNAYKQELGFLLNNTEHCAAQQHYQDYTTKTAHAQFVMEFSVHWSEFSHLPYFNLCCMIVMDSTCDAVRYDFMIDTIHEDNNIHHFENTGRNTNIDTLTQKVK